MKALTPVRTGSFSRWGCRGATRRPPRTSERVVVVEKHGRVLSRGQTLVADGRIAGHEGARGGVSLGKAEFFQIMVSGDLNDASGPA